VPLALRLTVPVTRPRDSEAYDTVRDLRLTSEGDLRLLVTCRAGGSLSATGTQAHRASDSAPGLGGGRPGAATGAHWQ
jgi:hypothetical protein